MRLVLISGAGASRRLGGEDIPMPLMPDWSNSLCDALDSREKHLAAACHLRPGLSGEEFEENLGLLLGWRRVRYLEERFENLGGPQAGSRYDQVFHAREHMAQRLDAVMNTLNDTLYDEFGQRRVDDARAVAAYRQLLGELGDPEVVVATTNYDRASEAALAGLGRTVPTGFRAGVGRTPTLDPKGIVEQAGEAVSPVLHLHGAVGWYEKDGTVEDHYADQPYNPSLGTPVVLYPDRDKDPTEDPIVGGLWAEFRLALDRADHVMVLGHSLNDRALVNELLKTAENKKVAITYLLDSDVDRVRALVPGSIPIRVDFGPELEIDRAGVAAFRG